VPFWFKQGSALRPGRDARLPNIGEVKEWPRVAKEVTNESIL